MADRLTKDQRSWVMSRVRGKDTRPELRVRKVAHALGLRFRLHRRDLPGTPDLVFPRWKKVILVHGCFWHQHPGCKKASLPATRPEFWMSKLARNVHRDNETLERLKAFGWSVLVIWECETRQVDRLKALLISFFSLEHYPDTTINL